MHLPDTSNPQAASVDSSNEINDQSANAPRIEPVAAAPKEASERLSYKYQRVRERLREAIASGELSGRLPGERKLARKFRANAKTLSKALTDLAAEGLLDRSIGRGTFVKGSEVVASGSPENWLIICDAQQANSAVVQQLLAANPGAQCVVGMPPQRPSFLNSFKAVVIFDPSTPDAFIRDLVVRNVTVVVAGREPSTYSTHTVIIDRALGAATVARDLILAGHRRIAVAEERGTTQLTQAVRQTASRYATDASIEPIFVADLSAAIQHGMTALVCDSSDLANQLRAALEGMQAHIPRDISLVAIGSGDQACRCSGYFVSPQDFSESIVQILRDNSARRPITLLLAGKRIDCGTIGPTKATIDQSSRPTYTSVPA